MSTYNTKPTPAPWQHSPGDGLLGPDGIRVAALSYGGKSISQRIKSEQTIANGDLIEAACNAAQEANPENPIAAAKALPALLTFVRAFAETGTSDQVPGYWPPDKMDDVIRVIRYARTLVAWADGQEAEP